MQVTFILPDAPEHCFHFGDSASLPSFYLEHKVVTLNLNKIDDHISKEFYSYVGPNGSDQKPAKHKFVREIIQSGEAVEMPVMYAATSDDLDGFKQSVHVGDGWHRLWNLKDMGVEYAEIVVPRFQADMFTDVFG